MGLRPEEPDRRFGTVGHPLGSHYVATPLRRQNSGKFGEIRFLSKKPEFNGSPLRETSQNQLIYF